MSEHLDINHIKVGERHRKDFGDIESLALSIKTIGLLAPIVVDADNKLVAGHRRLEACRRLGYPNVPVRRVRQITDAVTALVAERDENTCRKDFTTSEAVALGMALEEMEAPKAGERKAAAGKANLPTVSEDQQILTHDTGRTRDIVGPAVGLSGATYQRAKHVVLAQNDPDPAVAQAAREATAEMDATGKVTTAVRKVKAARGELTAKDRIDAAKDSNPVATASGKSRAEIEAKVAKAKEMAARGATSRQIAAEIGISDGGMHAFRARHGVEVPADAVVGRQRAIDPNRVIETIAFDAGLITQGVAYVSFPDLDKERIPGWVSSLSEAIRSLNTLKRNLEKELTQ